MKRTFRKLLGKLAGENSSPINQNQHPLNAKKGPSVIIDPSALLTCPKNGLIELEGNNYVGRNVEIGPLGKISIGNNTSIQDRCILLGDIEIGRYCLFAPNVYISSGRHYYNHKPEFYIKDQDEMVIGNTDLSKKHSKKIIVEDDCWIGINVVIMSGVTIGKGSVIGANSVVTKDVEPYSIMSGMPAVVIKKRLTFELKNSIDYLNDGDLPYFYNGFYTNLKSLMENRKQGGIRIMNDFSACLNNESKTTISVHLKNTGNNSAEITYNNQHKKIEANSIVTIDFNIAATTIHKFKILSSEENHIFIQSIKTY